MAIEPELEKFWDQVSAITFQDIHITLASRKHIKQRNFITVVI